MVEYTLIQDRKRAKQTQLVHQMYIRMNKFYYDFPATFIIAFGRLLLLLWSALDGLPRIKYDFIKTINNPTNYHKL